MSDIINNTDLADEKLEPLCWVIDSSRKTLADMCLEHDAPLSEICALVVCVERDIVCLVVRMERRKKLVDALRQMKSWPNWPELEEQLRLVDTEPAMGQLRAVIVYVIAERSACARVMVQIHEGAMA